MLTVLPYVLLSVLVPSELCERRGGLKWYSDKEFKCDKGSLSTLQKSNGVWTRFKFTQTSNDDKVYFLNISCKINKLFWVFSGTVYIFSEFWYVVIWNN